MKMYTNYNQGVYIFLFECYNSNMRNLNDLLYNMEQVIGMKIEMLSGKKKPNAKLEQIWI